MNGVNAPKRIGVVYYLLVITGFLFITDLSVFLDIPILRQVSVFLCLTILPGFLLIRILNLSKLNFVTKYLFSVGLSIAVITFVGLFINWILPLVGVVKPLSFTPLLITVNALILILGGLCYKFDKEPIFININTREALSPPALLLLLLPLMTCLGGFLVRYYSNNTLLLLMLALVAVVVALIAFDKFIPQKLYPLAIYMISMALLLQLPLVMPHVTGTDILTEHYSQRMVELNAYWDPNIAGTSNTMPICNIWPATYSILMNIDGAWIFQIVFPLLYSLVPLVLYQAFTILMSKKAAFLAAIFYASFRGVFTIMINLGKQQVAELFVALLMILILDRAIPQIKRTTLLIIFSIILVMTHYAMSYLFIYLIVLAYILLVVVRERSNNVLTGTWVSLFVVMALGWYMYIASSVLFVSAVRVLEHIYDSIGTEMFALEARQSNILILLGQVQTVSIAQNVTRWLFRATNLLTVIGFIHLLWSFMRRRHAMTIAPEYLALSTGSMVLMAWCIIIPRFTIAVETNRLYTLALMFLAPLCILGAETVWSGITRIFKLAAADKFGSRIFIFTYINTVFFI